MGWAWCLICVGFNISLDAWVRCATWARNFKLVRASFEFWQLRERLTLKRMEGGQMHYWIDFSNMHKVIAKPTEWSNITGKLAYWKLHPMDQDSMPWSAWLSSAMGDTLSLQGSREKFVLRARAVLYSWIMTDWVLGFGLNSLMVWWSYATLFVCLFFFFTIHTFIHSFIHNIRSGPSPYLHSCRLSGRNLHEVPNRDSNSGLPYSKPAHYHLSCAALFFNRKRPLNGYNFQLLSFLSEQSLSQQMGLHVLLMIRTNNFLCQKAIS